MFPRSILTSIVRSLGLGENKEPPPPPKLPLLMSIDRWMAKRPRPPSFLSEEFVRKDKLTGVGVPKKRRCTWAHTPITKRRR